MKVNILVDPLPVSAIIGSNKYPIRYDYKTAIRYHLLLKDKDKGMEEKIVVALHDFYPIIPSELDEAILYMMWFYACGKEESETNINQHHKETLSFQKDDYLIYAAFREKYGIDLNKEDMHWWVFRALLDSIIQGIGLQEVVHARAVKLTGMSKEAKKYYSMLKREFALDHVDSCESVEDHKAKIKEYVDRRFKEASQSKERISGEAKV